MPENTNLIAVRLMVDWVAAATPLYYDIKVPSVEVGMHVTLPFSKESTPDDRIRIFIIQDLNWRADLVPKVMEAFVQAVEENERFTVQDFVNSGWKHSPV
jgi:hypothetical protein